MAQKPVYDESEKRIIEIRHSLIEYAADHSLDELLTKALDKVGDLVASPIGFYHFVENDQRTLSLQQWSTRTLKEFCKAEGKGIHYDIDKAGVWVDCVYEKKPVIHNDYASLSHKKGMPEGHPKVIRELVVPVIRKDKIVAILGVGNKPAEYTQKDMEIVSYLADVTWEIVRQKRAEEATRESEQRYREIFEYSLDCIYLHDFEGNFIEANAASLDLFGYTKEEIKSINFASLLSDDELLRAWSALQEIIEKGSQNDFFEYKVRNKNGEYIFIESKGSVIYRNGKPYAIMGTARDITDRKNAKEALQQSEEKFRGLVESSSDWIWEVNQEGVYTYSSPQVEAMLGYKPEEITGKTPFDLMPQEEVERIAKFFKNVLEKGEPITALENVNLHKDGRRIIMETSGIPYFNKDGKVMGYRGIDRDITERKQAEEELRESEIKHKTLVNNIPGMIYRAFADWSAEVISGSEAICGYTKKELMSKKDNWLSIIHPGDKEKVFKEGSELTKVQKDIVQQYRIKTKEGSIRWIEDRKTSIFSEQGEFLGIDGVVFDITEQKRVEEELVKLAEVVKHSSELINLATLDGRMIFLNEAGSRILGIDPDQVQTTQILEVIPDHLKDLVQQELLPTLLESGTWQGELQYRNLKTGKLTNVYAMTFTVNTPGMVEPQFLANVSLDITDRQRAEEEKRKALEFAAEQSKHALIGQVAGKMAHDFNNVLMGIMGNAQLAIMNCDDEKMKVKLERINEFSERGRDITNNLLTFSKDQEPKQTYFKIEDKIELVLKLFEKDLTGIKVSRNYKSGIPELLADPGMIQDVLVNLVQNSIHAVSKIENPILNLKAYSKEEKIYIEIEDNGCGIPKEHQDSIYTPSFTLKGSNDKTNSYKSSIKGTGYGMSNVKKYIIEKHKGDISLESEVGKGTRITIALQVIKDRLSSNEKSELEQRKIYSKKRILLVEDESAIADVQYQILTRGPFFHIVSIAVNGQTAIDIFDRNRFDVVSLDYMLPGNFNGLDVYNHIRKNNKDIPVMFISGNIEFLESIKRLKENDPNLEHISKPVDNLDYVYKINELAGRE